MTKDVAARCYLHVRRFKRLIENLEHILVTFGHKSIREAASIMLQVMRGDSWKWNSL